jgi:molybdopterin-guanine dinucleotide biosynthesis protein A
LIAGHCSPELDLQAVISRKDITGLVLAGGRGRRFHGQDKGLLPYDGQALIATVLGRLQPQVGAVVISANRHLASYQAYGWPVLTDRLADYQGPLAGLARGLEVARTPWLLMVPCDGPRLPDSLARDLAHAAERQGRLVAVAHDGRRAQYGFALIATTLAGDLHDAMHAGERRLGGWLARHEPALADFSATPEAFTNLNSPADLAALEL